MWALWVWAGFCPPSLAQPAKRRSPEQGWQQPRPHAVLLVGSSSPSTGSSMSAAEKSLPASLSMAAALPINGEAVEAAHADGPAPSRPYAAGAQVCLHEHGHEGLEHRQAEFHSLLVASQPPSSDRSCVSCPLIALGTHVKKSLMSFRQLGSSNFYQVQDHKRRDVIPGFTFDVTFGARKKRK